MSSIRIFSKGDFYHICTKSIAGYVIFKDNRDYQRMREIMKYYTHWGEQTVKFSYYCRLNEENRLKATKDLGKSSKIVNILAYCLMPTHIHLLLIPLIENSISLYMKNLLNSYTRYFNTKYSRKGPLWQGRFKDIRIESHEQLIHLTRYIHLNPTSSGIVRKPEDWNYSSYREYIKLDDRRIIGNWKEYINMSILKYRKFVEEQKRHQQELSIIKHLLLE